jgi:hypothetical protein
MSRCHHGHPICHSWQECPQCWAEHDEYEANQAAIDAVEEQRKQTALLEQIRRNQEEILRREKG